jgi:metal-responsive CopG/Arc/MetJ family transcriptional regulator
MQCMEDQLTLRIPKQLAQALARSARERGVPKSQVVREALREYLGQTPGAADRATLLRRLEAYRGIAPLDSKAIAADPLTRQIYEHNWRE